MFVLVPLALLGAQVAGGDAGFDLRAHHRDVLAGPADRQARRRRADVGAVEANADALPHVHPLGGAGVGA